MFGDMGRISAVVIVMTEVETGCLLFGMRHFSGAVEVCGVSVIDDMYISRMYTYRLSKDVMAINVASVVIFVAVSLLRISHLGIKPESGGSPPRDSSVVDRIIMVCGELVHMVPRSLIVVEVVAFIKRKIGVVIIIYIIKVRVEMFGAIVRVAMIHPVWAIDEKAISFRS